MVILSGQSENGFDETKALIENIIEKGKTPIIVGGTGLYFKAITDGLSPIPDIDYLVREELNDFY